MTRPAARLLLSSLAILAAMAPFARAADDAKTPQAAKEKVFVGYLFGPPRDLNFSLYTHLCHAFITADGDGKLRPSRNVPDRKLTANAHKAGVKVLISLGGWGWDKQFGEIVSKPESEKRYVDSVIKMMDENDYDGLDLDWEYPDTAEEVKGFERLTHTLRKRIDEVGKAKNRHMDLTMAASSNKGTLSCLNKDFLLENMDWVNVMTYDYAGDWTSFAGHQAPLFGSSKAPDKSPRSTAQTMTYLLEERGIPADHLAVGLPLYGRGFPVSEPYASTKGVAKKRDPGGDYRNIAKLIKQGWTRTYDEETKTPWLTAPDRSAVIGYDDAESIRLKTEWAMSKGFRGVFFWQVNGDRLEDGTNPLQAAAYEAWLAGTPKPSK
ncbi:glycoside hydrolase family 18 protein [Isosphaeraceae bacterium EP7]